MSILIMTIPIAMTLVLLFVLLFYKAAKGGQLDDLETPAHSLFIDEDEPSNGDKSDTKP